MPRHAHLYRARRRLALLPMLLLLALVARPAHASCSFDKIWGWFSYSSSPVNFSMASTVNIPFNYSYGTVLGSPVTSQPTNPPGVTCSKNTRYGVVNLFSGSDSGSPSYIYPTNVPGVGYQLTHANAPGQYMSPYPDNVDTSGGDSSFSVGTTLQLVQTGPIANGSVLSAGTLANWQWSNLVPEYFVLANSVTFVASACQVQTSSISVNLPRVGNRTFAGKDSTTGSQPFSIQLSCPQGSTTTLKIQFDAQAGTAPGYTTVLANQGTAAGVGVELDDSNGSPVVFGQAATVGTNVSGVMTLPYTAMYHATGNSVGGGTVKATATFTLSYE